MAELGEQEDSFAQNLEEYRGVLKQIRNTESSVQPSRDHKAKISDEIQKLKYKEPQSTKIVQLEQELVRAEAQNLVAEAQLTNIVSLSFHSLFPHSLFWKGIELSPSLSTQQTRQKLKEAYDIHFAATIERAEKQILLAKHGRRLLNLLDDTPVVPGDVRPAFDNTHQARQILNDAEEDLRDWEPSVEPIPSSAEGMGANLMPSEVGQAQSVTSGGETEREREVISPRSEQESYVEGHGGQQLERGHGEVVHPQEGQAFWGSWLVWEWGKYIMMWWRVSPANVFSYLSISLISA